MLGQDYMLCPYFSGTGGMPIEDRSNKVKFSMNMKVFSTSKSCQKKVNFPYQFTKCVIDENVFGEPSVFL